MTRRLSKRFAIIEVKSLFAGNWTDLQVLIKHAVMNATHHAVLFALFDLAKGDRHATILRLVEHTGLDRATVVSALVTLDRAGLADHERVRLTMAGLTMAMVVGAPKRSSKPVSRKAA